MDPAESADPDGSGLQLTYGVHDDVNLCTFDNTCTESGFITDTDDNGNPIPATPIPGEHCDTTSASGAFSLRGHCVLDADGPTGKAGQQPIATAASIGAGASLFWVVVGELLDGSTMEEFACACQEDPTAPGDLGALDPANCGDASKAWSIDPNNCGSCGGGSTQAGKCEDTDLNGVPDVSALLPGMATITCGTLLGGSAGTTGLGEGWYNPSGYQIPGRGSSGWFGIGPAIAITPAFDLPADEDCSLTINSSTSAKLALDKQGRTIAADAAINFHTEAVSVAASSPANKAKNVATNPSSISITFNTSLKASTVAGAVTITPAVPGSSVSLASPNKIVIAPTTTGEKLSLASMTMYTVTVSGDVTDNFGKSLGEDFTFTFTTK